MRYFNSFPLIIFLALAFNVNSQSRPQVRFKVGASKSIRLPGDNDGYAYQVNSRNRTSADLALEYSQAIKNRSLSWFAGISLDPQNVSISLNRSNFQTYDNDPEINVGETTFRFYTGLGKRIGEKDSRDHFYFFGGFGFAVNFGSHLTGWGSPLGSEGTTKAGEFFKSPYNSFFVHPGFQTWVYVEREFRITPTVFTGMRWQRVNRKGNDGLGLELSGTYGLGKYFKYKVPYTLNGIDHEDNFVERGFAAQMNLIIPVWNFKKRK
jgi:hypothetical protein